MCAWVVVLASVVPLECQDLDMGMLEDTHPDHDFYQMFSEPSDFGFRGLARYRTWVVGAHKDKTTCLVDPFGLLETLRSEFAKNVQAEVSDFLVASDVEIQLEAAQTALKRGKIYDPAQSSLAYLLSPREHECKQLLDQNYLSKYGRLARCNPHLVYFLGDSAAYCTWSANSAKIPTYRLNSKTGKYWLPAYDRWMTAKERLCSMGFPCTGELATSMQVPLLGAKDAARAADICGNAMHFTSCGIMQLISLACFGPISMSIPVEKTI